MLQSKYAGYVNSRNGPAGPSAGNGRPVLKMAGQKGRSNMELAANDRLIVKNILVQQVGFLGDASERAKDNTELLTLTAEMLDALKMIVLFDGSQEKDRRAGLSEEDDCTKKPALTTDQGQRQLMEAKRMLEREIATGSLKGLL